MADCSETYSFFSAIVLKSSNLENEAILNLISMVSIFEGVTNYWILSLIYLFAIITNVNLYK